MKQIYLKPLVVGIVCALTSGNALADVWADQVASSSGVTNPGNALHAPDALTASMDLDDSITLNFLDNICLELPFPLTDAGAVDDVDYQIIGFPDAPAGGGGLGWANQVTFEATADGTELDAVACDGGEILSYAEFGGVIGGRTIKGNEKTQNVSFEGVAYTAGTAVGDGIDTIAAQVGWLEVNYRNGVSCNFFPESISFNQIILSDGDQKAAVLFWDYECSNEDDGQALIVMLNSDLTSFDLGDGDSIDGVPANGTYYLPEATGKGRTKFRGAICINADNDAYDVDGGSNVVFDDGDGVEPICDDPGTEATDDNSGSLQWGEIRIGGYDTPFN